MKETVTWLNKKQMLLLRIGSIYNRKNKENFYETRIKFAYTQRIKICKLKDKKCFKESGIFQVKNY